MVFLSAWNWYGFLIALGMIVGMLGAAWVARWRGFHGEVAFDICLWAIPLAIVGARLNFVITDAIQGGSYVGWDGLLKVIGFENGEFIGMYGLSIYGGLIGAIAGIFFNSLMYKRHRKKAAAAVTYDEEGNPIPSKDREHSETFLNMLDLGAPFMILGQAIGRWGNLINGELYGAEVTNPSFQWWPVAIESGGTWYQALSFYESILNFLGSALLLWLLLGNRRSRPGVVVSVYFIWYGIVRACLEMQRQPEFIMYWGKMPVSLLDSLILIAVGLGMLIYFIVKAKRDGKRIPIYLKRSQWAQTGRDLFEWGRDYHQKLPPLFRRKRAAEEFDDEDDENYEPEDEDDALGSDERDVENEKGRESDANKEPVSEETPTVPAKIECPDCGSEIDESAKVCPFCGKRIGK